MKTSDEYAHELFKDLEFYLYDDDARGEKGDLVYDELESKLREAMNDALEAAATEVHRQAGADGATLFGEMLAQCILRLQDVRS